MLKASGEGFHALCGLRTREKEFECALYRLSQGKEEFALAVATKKGVKHDTGVD